MKSGGKLITAAAGALGAVIFVLIFGVRVLSPVYIDFLTRGDPGQHYYGWLLFRTAPWQPLIGMMNTADHPYSVSVIFTDSIPLCAVFFKIFRGILPDSFQYFGMWGLLCFILQGIIAERILSRYVKNPVIRLIGCIFFIITPAFIRRSFWHIAMASHWLLLLSIYFYLVDGDDPAGISEKKCVTKTAFHWAVLGALCASIHLYYLGMCGLIAVILAVRIRYERQKVIRAVMVPVSFVGSSVAVLWILGAFHSGMSSDAPGLGFYSFNLLGFFIPDGWSSILPKIPYYADGQVEGFSYMGLGFIVIMIISVFYAVKAKIWQRPVVGFGLGIIFAAVLIGASAKVSAGPWLLWKYDVSGAGVIKKLWEIFRSSGRFAWIPLYLIMAGAFSVIGHSADNEHKKMIIVLASMCLILQVADIYPGIKKKHDEVINTEPVQDMLPAKKWTELAESGKFRHIVFMDKDKLSQEELYGFAGYAAKNGMTLNDFYFARSFDLHIREIAEDSAYHPSEDTMYIFSLSQQNVLDNYDLTYYAYDGYFIGIKEN
ncbi:hypothetical protein SAMN06296386_103128 [Lachnospiraceae bacterium]|nr:hypothetical protein SAMN06296386_103128 [Lachnospiraceae bacterium]